MSDLSERYPRPETSSANADDDVDRLCEQLRAMSSTADGRASAEEVEMVCRMLGLDPPGDDLQIPPPTGNDVLRLRVWLQDRERLSERERVELFCAYHRSAAWRAMVEQLSSELGLK